MNTKPKADLFSFVTLRSPQLIHEAHKSLGFIFHPDTAGSHFLSDISDGMTVEQARLIVEGKEAAFKNGTSVFDSIYDVEHINTDLWGFSNLLMREKNHIKETIDLNQIKQDLINLKEQYDEDYDTAYANADAIHKAKEEIDLNQFVIDYPEFSKEINDPTIRKENYSIENVVPDDIGEVFQFSFLDIFSDAYMSGKVEEKTVDFIKTNKYQKTTYRGVITQLDKRIKKLKKNSIAICF